MSQKPARSSGECVKVVIRCRPMDKKEVDAGHTKCVSMDTKRGTVVLRNPKGGSGEDAVRTFTFDAVYDTDSKQQELYDETFRELVQSVLDGFNGTIFAYGQTGTGKTFTMQGVKEDPELRGVIPNSFEHIFTHISRSKNSEYLVRASYLEIYKEEVRDLLHKDQEKRLEIKEKPDTGVYVKDLSSVLTRNIREIEKVMNIGNANRSVGATNMNEHSSRSHAIFIVTIECSEVGGDGEPHIRVGKLNMVDLAGSERQSKTQSEGERLKEATKINLSLSALGNVISALVDGKSTHIPYRDSKLTRLLQDSLGGNARTVMVANIGPASYNFDESVNTLRYANRAKNIKNKPKINEDPKDALLREYQTELERLKSMLHGKGGVKRPSKSGRKRRERKKKTRMLADGTVEEYSSSGSEEEDSPEQAQLYMQEQQEKLDAERNAILADKTLISGEKERLLRELQERETLLNDQRAEKTQLAAKIKAMESKLLIGGKNIIDHTNNQQRVLEQKRLEIAEQKNREREIQKQMEDKNADVKKIQRGFASLREEVETYTKMLKAKFVECQNLKKEIDDCTEEHVRARQELEHHQEALTRELKKQLLILENFVPPEDLEKFQKRAHYDEDAKTWRLIPLAKANEEGQSMAMEKRPRSALGHRRPVSEFARAAANMGMNPRFRHEQLLSLQLDLPSRTTRDYEPPAMAPQVVAALEAALQDEDDLELDGEAITNKGKNSKRDSSKKSRRPRTSKGSRTQEEEYPTSRGFLGRK